jgi:CBS domain-containing protein
MTREVATLYEEDNLERIEEAMQRFRFHHVPVVDGRKLVGLVSHRDLLRVSASAMAKDGEARTHILNQQLFVRDVMTRDIETTTPATPLAEAARTMLDRQHGCLPVVDDGELVGIITLSDIVKVAIELLDQEQQ